MNKMEQLLTTQGNWLFIVPIDGLELTEAVNYEFTIDRTVFIEKKKLARVRKRFGFPKKISELEEKFQNFFEASNTFAILRYNGNPEELRGKCLRRIEDHLSILALSQLGFSKRRYNSFPSIYNSEGAKFNTHMFVNTKSAEVIRRTKRNNSFRTLVLNEKWKKYHEDMFFTKLIKVLNGKEKIADSWKESLERASILIGQSLRSNDIPQSFLWNMIALETLLTDRGDTYIEALPQRLEAFLGWVGFWEDNNYEAAIQDLYKKRSAFVHDGNKSKIAIDDLLFTDDLLFNLLINLILHLNLYNGLEISDNGLRSVKVYTDDYDSTQKEIFTGF